MTLIQSFAAHTRGWRRSALIHEPSELAATYSGRLEIFAEANFHGFAIEMTPAPDDSTFAFYEGPVGDTSNFVGGGGIQSTLYVSASHNTQYWARVDNGTCHVDTSATVVTVY